MTKIATPTVGGARLLFGKSPIRQSLVADHKSRAFDVWLLSNVHRLMEEARGAQPDMRALRRLLLLIARCFGQYNPNVQFTPAWVIEVIVSIYKDFGIKPKGPPAYLTEEYWVSFAATLQKMYGGKR